MPTTVCPFGTESQPGAPAWLQITDALLADVIASTPFPLSGILAGIVGSFQSILDLCDQPHPGYPVFELADFVSQWLLADKIKAWLLAHLWDTYCQCSLPPGGCGSVFLGTEAGLVSLDAFNATHHEDTPAGETPATYVNRASGWAYHQIDVNIGSGLADGDLLIAFGTHNETTGLEINGTWNYLDGADFAGNQTKVWWRFWHTGDLTTYRFHSTVSGYVGGFIESFRGANPTSPIATHAAASGSSGTILWPSVTLAHDHQMTVGLSGIVSSGWNGAYPANWIGLQGLDATGLKLRTGRREDFDAGASGDASFGTSAQYSWSSFTVVVAGISADAQEWLSWTTADDVAHGWAVQTESGDLVEFNQHGASPKGYRIECRWWDEEGGTLAGEVVQWLVYDLDDNLLDTVEVAFFAPIEAAVWPCVVLPTPEDDPDFPEGPANPHTPTEDTLLDIAAEIDRLEAKLDALAGTVAYVAGVVSQLQGPYSVTVGQARETIEGDFEEVVLGALEAMSNYVPSGFSAQLIASGIEGDSGTDDAYAGYALHFTTIPAWVGYRMGDPKLYEVNSRVLQLGWLAFKVGDGLLDYRISVWENMSVWCPAGTSAGLIVHIAEGCIADLYGLTPVYTPVGA